MTSRPPSLLPALGSGGKGHLSDSGRKQPPPPGHLAGLRGGSAPRCQEATLDQPPTQPQPEKPLESWLWKLGGRGDNGPQQGPAVRTCPCSMRLSCASSPAPCATTVHGPHSAGSRRHPSVCVRTLETLRRSGGRGPCREDGARRPLEAQSPCWEDREGRPSASRDHTCQNVGLLPLCHPARSSRRPGPHAGAETSEQQLWGGALGSEPGCDWKGTQVCGDRPTSSSFFLVLCRGAGGRPHRRAVSRAIRTLFWLREKGTASARAGNDSVGCLAGQAGPPFCASPVWPPLGASQRSLGEERAGAPSHRAHLPDPGALAGREARYCRWSPALNTPSRWTPRKQGLTTPSGGINFRQDSGLLCPPLVSPRNDRAAL